MSLYMIKKAHLDISQMSFLRNDELIYPVFVI